MLERDIYINLSFIAIALLMTTAFIALAGLAMGPRHSAAWMFVSAFFRFIA